MNVGFDISLAEVKLDKIYSLLVELENSPFKEICENSREDIVDFIQICYGISYEIGNTKQQLSSKKDEEIAEKVLPIARLIFGKSRDLLPYLTLNLHISISDKAKHEFLKMEISEIEKLNP